MLYMQHIPKLSAEERLLSGRASAAREAGRHADQTPSPEWTPEQQMMRLRMLGIRVEEAPRQGATNG